MKKGFTLVELSIALVIIGLLIGGSVQMMSMLSKRAKVTEAKQQLDTLKERIIGYAQSNEGRLPTQNEFYVDKIFGDIEDPWGKTIIYHFSNSDSACDVITTGLKTTIDGVDSVQNVGFVLVSSGANHNMQTSFDSVQIKLSTPENKLVDFNTSDIGGVARPEEYDDLSVIVSLSELQSIADCQRTKLQIINTILPRGTADINYSTTQTVVATGGKEPYSFEINSSSKPTGSTFSENTFVWDNPIAGNHKLKFKVTDDKGATDERTLLLVIDSPPPPAIQIEEDENAAYDACMALCAINPGPGKSCEANCNKLKK